MCLFLLLCILAMFAIHAITQIASKTEKLWAAKKTSSQFRVWRWYDRRGFEKRAQYNHGKAEENPLSHAFVSFGRDSSPCKQGEPRRLRRCAAAGATALTGQGILSFRHGVLILYRRATSLLRGRRGGYRRKAADLPQCESSTLHTPHYSAFRIPHSAFRITKSPSVFFLMGKKTAPLQ